MPDFQLSSISLIMLGVQDLNRSVSFYRDKLGVTVRNLLTGFAFLDCGGVTLALSEPLLKANPVGAGAAEVVFSVQHVREAHRALVAQGVEFNQEPRQVSGPFWAANFKDPDGHQLSVFGNE